jgi:hypothetical protein
MHGQLLFPKMFPYEQQITLKSRKLIFGLGTNTTPGIESVLVTMHQVHVKYIRFENSIPFVQIVV